MRSVSFWPLDINRHTHRKQAISFEWADSFCLRVPSVVDLLWACVMSCLRWKYLSVSFRTSSSPQGVLLSSGCGHTGDGSKNIYVHEKAHDKGPSDGHVKTFLFTLLFWIYLKVCILMSSHGHLFLFISLIFLCKPLVFFYQINIVKQQLDLYKLTSMELNLNDYLIKFTLTSFLCLTE